MKAPIDNFSKQSDLYKKFRPHYPSNLYKYILSNIENTSMCWDCGTGNGQVAAELAKHFDKVYATDISKSQINNAIQKDNITYSLSRAEQTNFEDNQFDLVTVAQAVHWFDIEAFNKEVKRVLKKGGTIAIWGYGILGINDEIDPFIRRFYYETVYQYWDAERKHIDEAYKKINLDFENMEYKTFSMHENWTLQQLTGYLNTWSSVQNYKEANNGQNPVNSLSQKLLRLWPTAETKTVAFPVFMQLGRCNN